MKKYLYPLAFLGGIVLPLFLYLGWSLSSLRGWILLTFLFSLIFSFPFLRMGNGVLHLTYLSMGYLTYLMVFIIVRDLLRLSGHFYSSEWIYIFAAGAVILGNFIARRGPRLVHKKISYPELPLEFNGLRIVQLSDLHVGPTIRRHYVEKVVKSVNDLRPDLIALTGDMGDGPVEKYRDDISPLSQMKSSYGAFFVPGNHEHYWNSEAWINLMRQMNITVLLNQGKQITHLGQQLLVGGVPDPVMPIKPDPKKVFDEGNEAGFKILLSHRPGIALEASRVGFDLQLSGHTHGGQFFPWTLIARLVHKHLLGLHKIDRMWLYVNSGTGSWGPLLRLGTFSEITHIEVSCSGKSLE